MLTLLQDLEKSTLKLLDFLILYYCYADDIILISVESVNDILTEFNDYHNYLNFTIECEL